MIKLIVSVIDGTLVADGKSQVNPELLQVILKLRAKGVQFAAASGRQWASIESVFHSIREKIFYISDNGAYIGCCGRNLFLNTIDREVVESMIHDVRGRDDLDVMVSGPDVVYLETENEEFVRWLDEGYKFRICRVPDLTKVEDSFIKISVYRKNSVEGCTRDLRQIYGDKLKMTISGDMWLDCMKTGVSKGKAVEILQESLEISPKETMVFGDQLNDMEMMERAYYSFAVGNAREEIKKAARYQTDTNVNDGVLKILKLLL